MSDMISRLGLDIETSGLARGQAALDRLREKSELAAGSATRLERATATLQRQMMGLVGVAASLGAVMGVGFGIAAVLKYGDAWKVANNQLKLAVETTQELQRAQEGVFQVAQDTFQSFMATANLSSKIERFAGNITGSLENTLDVVETINKAVAVGGTAAASAEAGLFQLNQALGAGVLRGEELNSVMEQLPIVAKAIADGLGQPIGKLRTLAEQGQLTSEIVIRALQSQADEIDAAFARIEPTMAQAGQKLQNALTKFFGTAGAPIFEGITQAISDLADTLGDSGVIQAATETVRSLVDILSALGGVLQTIIGLLPAVAAGFAAMMVVKALTPFFVLLEASMTGSIARAMALAAATNALTGAFVTARTAIAGTIAALGGPLGIAVGIATAVIVGLATSARDAAADIRTIPEAIEEAVSRMRAALGKTQDENPIVRAAGASDVAATLNAARQKIADATDAFNDAIAARDVAYEKARRISEQRGIPLEDIRGYQQAIDLVNQKRMELEAAQSAWEAVWWDVDNFDPTGGVRGGRSPLTLPTPIDEEALKKAKRELDAVLQANEEFIEKVRQAQADLASMVKEMADASTIVDRAIADGATTEELEDQLDILRDTNQLLSGPLALAYAAMGDKAAETARQHAVAAQQLRNQIQTARELLRINTEVSRLPRLAAALAVGPEEFELTLKTFDLMERMPGLTEEQVRAEAQKLRIVERVTEELQRQAQRAKQITEAPARNWIDGLTQLSDDFWTNWVDKGWEAFDDLGDAFKDLWKRLASDMLRLAFEPIRMGIMNAMGFGGMPIYGMPIGFPGAGGAAGAAGGGAGGAAAGGGGFGGFFNSLFGFGAAGGFAGFNAGSLGSLAQMVVASQGSLGLGALGFLNGSNWMGADLANMLSGVIGDSLAASIGTAMGDIFNPANAMGGMFGSGLASLLGFNGKNAGIGGTIGGLAGSFFGPIGSIVGSFLGQALGSIIGPQESDHGAVATVDSRGRLTSMAGGKRTSETEGAARTAVEKIAEGQDLLRQLGATLGATVDKLIIGTRDQSRYSLTGDARDIQTGTVGDPEDLIMDALAAVLKKATFDNPILQEVASAMSAAGRGFQDTIEVLGTLADILPDTTEPLSEWGEALKRLNETFADLREQTNGLAEASLAAAEAQAKARLREEFDKSIADQLLEAQSPLQAQMKELLKTQTTRAADAAALGGNLADVLALNAIELKQFIQDAAGTADAFGKLNEEFANLREAAIAAGQDVAAMDAAFNAARQQIVASFDEETADAIRQLTNPTLAALEDLLNNQRARIEQARAIGANLVAVQRLNALETQKFFANLSSDQRRQLGDYLGIIEDFTGKIAVTLQQLGDELSSRIDDLETRRQDLLDTANRFRNLATGITDTRQSIMDRYGDLTPAATLEQLRSRFGALTEDARLGNESAIAALPQVATQLIELSRSLYGSTKAFRTDYDLVTSVLDEVGGIATDRADTAESQAQTLLEQRDLLIGIRDALASPDPALDFLEQQVSLLDQNNGLIAELLQAYLYLTAQQASQVMTDAQLVNGALNSSIVTGGTNPSPGGVQSGDKTTGTGVEADALVEVMAAGVDVSSDGFKQLLANQEVEIRELRKLNTLLTQQLVA